MSVRHQILLSLAILALFGLLLVIVFGDHGVADLNMMRLQKADILEDNERVVRENQALYRTIERLESDLGYIENVARQDLGMIGKDEWVFKMKKGGQSK